MHGSYFPEIESGDVISSSLFIGIMLVLCLCAAIFNRLFPKLASSSLKGLAVASGVLIIWEVLAILRILSPALLPAPGKVLSNIVYLWSIGFLQPQIGSTLYRLAYAFILALFSAIGAGILVSYFSKLFSPIESLINAARLIPAPAWLSVSILWFGIGHASAIFIIWLGCFFPIFLNTINGVNKAERVQVETVLTFGGSRFDVLWAVIIPVAYHHILAGARIGLGIGWITVITAELASVDAGAGLGWMIQDSRILLDTTTVLSGIIVIGMLGMLTDFMLNKFDGLVQGWS